MCIYWENFSLPNEHYEVKSNCIIYFLASNIMPQICSNNWPWQQQQNMFGINPLLFQNSIFYNTVIYCYMCDLMGNVQCLPIMKHSHKVFLSTYQYSMIVRSLCWYIYLVLTAQLLPFSNQQKHCFWKCISRIAKTTVSISQP